MTDIAQPYPAGTALAMGVRAKSGSPYETTIGFSRGVRIGDRVIVSGTGPIEADGTTTPGGAFEQANRCCAIIADALQALGSDADAVILTRMYLTDAADAAAVGDAHRHWFGAAAPAATMVVVAALLRPEWRVEIEVEAIAR